MNRKQLFQEARNVADVLGQRVQMHIPSILAEHEVFSLRISVTGNDGLPVDDFRQPIRFTDSQGIEGLPRHIELSPGESVARIEGLRALGPDVALVRAEIKPPESVGIDAAIASNPAWVFKNPPYRIFWGDLHVHTRFSDCSAWRCLHPRWCYLYAREISMLDFAAAADHLRGIVSKGNRWPELQRAAREFNRPGEFVTFLAFESSHAKGFGGDNNVYFAGDDASHFWLDRDDMHGNRPAVHLKTLWEQMDQAGTPYFTVPHHTRRLGKYRTWEEPYHDPAREPLFEIFSGNGSSEMKHSGLPDSGGSNDDPSYFVDALKAGARFGVIAASDDHATMPGSALRLHNPPYTLSRQRGFPHSGLAAVRCHELTRHALFDALRRRHTYATTHARSLIDMHIGDASLGEEIEASGTLKTQREIRIRLTLADTSKAWIVLMRNGEPFAREALSCNPGRVHEISFTDNDSLDAVAVRGARYHPDPFVVYTARVEASNGSHQWTSPIWIDGK